MSNPLALKLKSVVDLSDADQAQLDGLLTDVRTYKAKQDLIKEGDRPEVVFLVLKGWAYRYKILPDGGRQIMAYLLPGDLCDPHIFILKEMDHSIGLLSDARVAAIPKAAIIAMTDENPRLARGLWWSTLVDEGTLREWLANLGHRDAHDRIAHLLAELWLRPNAVCMTNGGRFELPLTQEILGDTMGLTSVHVNRMLQQLRDDGLVEWERGRMCIPDVQRLMNVTRFESNYLHLQRRTG